MRRRIITLSILLSLGSFNVIGQTIKQIQNVNFADVTIHDKFWNDKQVTVADKTLWACVDYTEHKTGRIRNFERAAGTLKDNKGHEGIYYDDSDVYKALEAIAYSLKNKPDAALSRKADEWITKIAAAQQADGYLNTYYTLKGLEKRWTDMEKHEDYCGGHLIEAGIAYFHATGKRQLLDVSIKMADHLFNTFIVGKKHWVVGHQGLELALVRLYKETKNSKYLELADWFINERGHGHGKGAIWDNPNMGKSYTQDDVPLAQARKITGHAVRAMYYYSGAADVASLKKKADYVTAMKAVWEDVTYRNMYLTGAIGSSHNIEGFTKPYDLPNAEAYGETCASVGMVYWNSRMFELTGESKYYDVLERSLYNGCLSGISLSGDRFFYPNPLASEGTNRKEWFGTACCPSNIARLLASVGNYIYAKGNNKMWINLYIGSSTKIKIANTEVAITQNDTFLENGTVKINVDPVKASSFEMLLRLPGWAAQSATSGNLYYTQNFTTPKLTVLVNNQPASYTLVNGYVNIKRTWKKGDVVDFSMPMDVLRIKANDQVLANTNRVAIQRGPFVYCLEGVDNPSANWSISNAATFSTAYDSALLNGVAKITIQNPADPNSPLQAIPYFTWANRGKSKMEVWVKQSH